MKFQFPLTVQTQRVLLIIFTCVGLVIRIIYTSFQWNSLGGTAAFGDDWNYIVFAQEIIKQGPLVLDNSNIEAFSGPGFPWLLSLLFLPFGENFFIPISLNILLSTAMIPLIYILGKRLFNSTVGVMASFWTIFYVPFFLFTSFVLKENLNLFLFTTLFICFHKIITHKNYPKSGILAFTLLFAYFVHVDERYLIHFVLLLFLLIIYHRFSKSSFFTVSLMVIGMLVFMAPWLIRNYYVYNRPVILTERLSTFTDKILGFEDQNRLILRSRKFEQELTLFRDSISAGFKPVPKYGRMQNVKDAMDHGLYPHSFGPINKITGNIFNMWSPIRVKPKLVEGGWKYLEARSGLQNIVYVLQYGLLFPFLFVGLFASLRKKDFWGIAIFIILGFHTMFHAVLGLGLGRYRFPIDGLFLALSMYGLWLIIVSLRSNIKLNQSHS